MKDNGAIAKVVGKLESEDSSVRAAAFTALQEFGKHGSSFEPVYDLYLTPYVALYHDDIISTISTIVERLDNDFWAIRKETLEILVELFSLGTTAVPSAQSTGSAPHPADNPSPLSNLLEALSSKLRSKKIIHKVVAKLVDRYSEVRKKANLALQGFSAHSKPLESVYALYVTFFTELYQPDIKSFIPTIITHLNNQNVYIRAETAETLKGLSKFGMFCFSDP